MKFICDKPWLKADLGGLFEVLSWAPYRPGFVQASEIWWREVRNEDLTEDFDAIHWLKTEITSCDPVDCVCFLTSRDVSLHHSASATVEGIRVDTLATVGLGNVETVGSRCGRSSGFGTINIATQVHANMSEMAKIEALTIIAEARTAAIMETEITLPEGRATGTGTDCIALASAIDGERHDYAGLHTALGEAIGKSVRETVLAGARSYQPNLPRLKSRRD